MLTACGPLDGGELSDATSSSSGDATEPMSSTTSLPPDPDPSTVTSDASSSTDASISGFIGDIGPFCGPAPDGTLFHCTECDVWQQDCPSGEKCSPYANDGSDTWNATICVPVDPEGGGPGDACIIERTPASGRDTCGLGSMCWDADPETLEGECVETCQGSQNDPICTASSTGCMTANEGVLILCLPTCDPLEAEACEDGHSCRLIRERWFCLRDGAPVNDGPLTPTLCPPATTEVDADQLSTCAADELCCAEICDATAPTCAAPLECRPLIKDGTVGLCLDPT